MPPSMPYSRCLVLKNNILPVKIYNEGGTFFYRSYNRCLVHKIVCWLQHSHPKEHEFFMPPREGAQVLSQLRLFL